MSMTNEPTDRLTRMCDAMLNAFTEHPEYLDGDKCIVFLDDRVMGGIVLSGYDDTNAAIAALLLHLQAMITGRDLDVVFLGDDGVGKL